MHYIAQYMQYIYHIYGWRFPHWHGDLSFVEHTSFILVCFVCSLLGIRLQQALPVAAPTRRGTRRKARRMLVTPKSLKVTRQLKNCDRRGMCTIA